MKLSVGVWDKNYSNNSMLINKYLQAHGYVSLNFYAFLHGQKTHWPDTKVILHALWLHIANKDCNRLVQKRKKKRKKIMSSTYWIMLRELVQPSISLEWSYLWGWGELTHDEVEPLAIFVT